MNQALRRFILTPALPRLAAVVLGVFTGLAAAQKIDDVPPMVQNNVPPNFMFMIDSSGSMSNIVPAAPYSPTATYLASCPSANLIAAGASVDLNTVSGAPRIVQGNNTWRHISLATSGSDRRCFNNTATYSARLLADTGSGGNREPGSYLDAEYSGHFLNWYFGNYDVPASGGLTGWTDRKRVATGAVQTRMEIARSAAKSAMDSLPLGPTTPGALPAVRVGLANYASAGAALRVPMGNLTSASRTTINSSIDGITPSGATPLASTFADLGRYMATGYAGNVDTAKHTGVNIDTLLRHSGTDAPTARNSCPTGAPNCSSTGDNVVKPIQYWCQRSFLFAMTDGRPQTDRAFNNNTYIRDYDGDCSGSNSASCVSNGAAGSWDRKTARTYESNGSDYMDDVAKLLFDIDLRPDLTKPTVVAPNPPARNNLVTYMIGFADNFVQNDPLLINTARQGGGRFIAAQDGPTLVSAFKTIIADALAKDASAAAVGVTSTQVAAGSVGYASSYNAGGWYGDLIGYSLDLATGLQSGAAQWSARERLEALAPSSRRIASYNASSRTGVAFTTGNGGAFRGQAASLSDNVINYTRGDRSLEGTTFRARPYLLGDIINAEPVVVNYASGPVVYQAANDGMLHAIDGRIASSATTRGQELWAYVPQLVHSRLAARADPTVEHAYLVDATPATAAVSGMGSVTRMLVGGLGKGGQGYYALDISSGSANNEAAAVSKVMWEFKAANMGYSFGTPLIINTAAGWKVVVASGYGNDGSAGSLGGDGRGRVWVLNAQTGEAEKEFVTPIGYGSSSGTLGLAHLANLGGNGTDTPVRHVYGGDLLGNMWRFDLEAPTLSAPVRIAQVTDPSGNSQPITVPPVVARATGSSSKVFLYFGTGRYFSNDDVPGTPTANASASQVQTLYGVIDDTATSLGLPNIRGTNGATCPAGGGTSDYLCQTAVQSGNDFTATHHELDLASKRGFYLDIPITAGRVNVEAAVSNKGTLVFVVNRPKVEICNPGGSGYLFTLSARNGGAVRGPGNTYYNAGSLIADALFSRPLLVTTSDGTRALLRGSNNTTESRKPPEEPGTAAGVRRVYKRALN